MSTNLPKVLKSFESLAQLAEYCQDAQDEQDDIFIFRGTTIKCSTKKDGINSSLYRWGRETAQFTLADSHYQLPNMGKEFVGKARRFFPDDASNRTILTSSRHLKGRINLIDFSRKRYVALFFACNGDFERDGELILVNIKKIKKLEEIDYNKLPEFALMEPDVIDLVKKRASTQYSIFVYAKTGYIEQEKYTAIPVAKEFKEELLKYLKQKHNVFTNSIYDDLFGFVENDHNYNLLPLHISGDLDDAGKSMYESANENYSETMNRKLTDAIASFNRGNTHRHMNEYDSAIDNYNKAIDLKPDYAEAYNNRGGVHMIKEEYDLAIVDFTMAIDHNSDDEKAYSNRGIAYDTKDEYDLAIADYTKAINLKPDFVSVYNNRGTVYVRKAKYDLAIADYTTVIELEPDNAAAYNTAVLLI